jgi:hypothetical protein
VLLYKVKLLYMKIIFILLTSSVAATAQAQEFQPELDKIINKQEIRKMMNRESSGLVSKPNILFNNNTSNRVQVLPQDFMPCIVPDTKEIAVMPNAWQNTKLPDAGQIPNAIPQKPSLPDLKTQSK